MNVAAAIAAAAALVAVLAGALSRRLSLAPGWRDQQGFSRVAFSAAAYAVCNLGTTLALPDPVVTAASRFQVASAVLHFWAWLGYSETFAGIRPGRAHQAVRRGFLALAALATVPGVVFTSEVVTHEAPAFGASYRDALPTPFGNAVFALLLVGFAITWCRFLRAWRTGVRYAGVHAIAFGALILFGLNDALATTGEFPTPYLLDTGFIVPIVAVYWTITVRFADNARALQSMRARLEELVEARTRALADAQAALHQSEKLAALGRFATAAAHRDPRPRRWRSRRACCVLEEALRGASAAPDTHQALADALAALDRLGAVVRALADAGDAAAADPGGRAAVAEVVRATVSDARVRAGERIRSSRRSPTTSSSARARRASPTCSGTSSRTPPTRCRRAARARSRCERNAGPAPCASPSRTTEQACRPRSSAARSSRSSRPGTTRRGAGSASRSRVEWSKAAAAHSGSRASRARGHAQSWSCPRTTATAARRYSVIGAPPARARAHARPSRAFALPPTTDPRPARA